ncbi:single-stranded DNA-binding protein [Brevibacterium sp. 50QC2O2]|jgi:single-strand DNA-binding protein|uniref:single-stranded DNA-binding protein n=1 Tax=Brevibacterium TaxID=1696 RepID=UPI00211C11D2|nr:MULTISPECIES: single-stranded DNA-binding protein [unclassified Brevibacterium]MCQ9368700.1 single-stranded DNA-binding protein [Brevibacterium sp. 91QC2O2]MCQ9386948.1 single-stranded DNA-binding protein [Brevibacterium sp. 68QC2CO]MCQ9389940.1 single-stranded DNA-binding protein [Brevibacterium sp. 50QC2O2]
MAGETIITVVGNLTADPDLRFTPNGAAVANFTVASTPRTFDRRMNEFKDGETMFLRCAAWRDMAENVASSLSRGTRVVVQGRLRARTFETKEGENRTVFELDVDEVGPSLRYATANVTRNERSGGGNQGGYGGGQQRQGGNQGGYNQPQGNPGGGYGNNGFGNNNPGGGFNGGNQGGSQWGQNPGANQGNGGGAPAPRQDDDPWASSNPNAGGGGWGNPTDDEPPF